RIDEHGVCYDKIERALRALDPRHLAHSIAKRLSGAEDELVTIGRQIRLDLRDEPGVGKMDAIARGRPILARVVAAINEGAHDVLLRSLTCVLARQASQLALDLTAEGRPP